MGIYLLRDPQYRFIMISSWSVQTWRLDHPDELTQLDHFCAPIETLRKSKRGVPQAPLNVYEQKGASGCSLPQTRNRFGVPRV